ncbi:cholinephosphate cytidylyltransferase/choline kinase family protein [[Clostridium] methylpentosum DSM 5476]|uniref:Cholinephosphate cytidylyltransferase/choline kinase family protein n=1 Tax=[Clostridium] methylpentosum DSM 5476 TaxID=537013 RepID=C0EB93_9FIRM|nr:cholinephosphate cytidylyltransferase/choline kinase family protein [[Clostridium] methylpentosum DSM 5476]MDY3988065.1 sugar phosphate nucleotidyltransferase [Massilioclostridium sp.]MEE1492063.1 sugar phosphate nucleotidyltransferase [Massilioclostridium sp.]
MKLTRKQFEILTYLEKHRAPITQRDLARATGMSLGSVNKTITQLTECGYLCDHTLTEQGITALEPYRVKRAIFIAAGFGSRLVPITLNTPKPLVRVKGTRMIDTLLDAVVAVGIEEIVIVRGYLGEQFDQLLYKYPNIRFAENPSYNEANNISSAMCVRYLMQNAYVFDADLVLSNPDLITKYQYTSNYLGVPVERTDDWCFETKNNVITKMTIGGINCYHMYGVSYWNAEDGAKLAGHIEQVYNQPGGKERYWDQVALEFFIKEYRVEVRPCSFDDIIEIDAYKDLKAIDSSYC